MAACTKVYYLRGRRRQPYILHLNDGLSVDDQIMAASHFLAHIQQQRIVTSLGNVECSLIDITLAHLLAPALGRGDVHHLAAACTFALDQFDAMAAGVEIDKSVVVPQHAVALARQQHGQTYLSVDLCQSAGQPTYIRVAVLELPEAEEALILGRSEGQRGNAVSQLMTCSGEHHPTLPVLHRQHLPAGVDVELHIARSHLTVLHIEPVGQVALRVVLSILNSHSIACHGGHRQLSFTKLDCLGLGSQECRHR